MSAFEAPTSSSLGAMGPVLRKLDSLLRREYRLPKPLKDGVVVLKKELIKISADLVKQSKVDYPNQKAKYWMDEVRGLSYDIEDCLDKMIPSCRRRVKIARVFKRQNPCKWIPNIAGLRTLVLEANDRHERYKLDDCISSSSHVFSGHGPVPALYGNNLIGVDDSRTKVMLIDGADEQLKVVPKVGSAAVGKTTLLAKSRPVNARLQRGMSSSLGAMDATMSLLLGSILLGEMDLVFRKVDLLLSSECRLPKSVKHGILLLREDLEEISGNLTELSMVDFLNQRAMDEMRQLFFHIEDSMNNLLPTCTDADAKIRSVHSHRVARVKVALLSKTLKPRTRIAKIAELRTRVRKAIERQMYQLDGCTSSSSRPVPALYGQVADYLVGINDSRVKLMNCLINDADQQLKVVPIAGSAGVGKTTLAEQVYRELGCQFECRAFVRASRKPNMRRLVGGILSQVGQLPRPPNYCTVENLIDNLREHLRDKKYFIVIDDLWETTTWDIINRAFPKDNNSSRILTTTEIEGVALEWCGYQSDNILKLKPLGSVDSEKLFYNKVFGPDCPCPDQLKEVSQRIVAKCAGLPLAITCVAGLLASHPENSELWHHVQKCLYSSWSRTSTLEEMLKEVLELSYNSLPPYMKTCLLYLSMYPMGYIIWKADLLKLWIVEGFVPAIKEKDIEEVAESFFDELVNRGMIHLVNIDHNDVLCCTMHHTILDLIMYKSQEENFSSGIDYSRTITGLSTMVHRLSVHFNSARYATKMPGVTLSHLRSLVFCGPLRCLPSVVKFQCLRVLILEFWGGQYEHRSVDLTRIYTLFLLRYLKISCDVTVELPTQMQGLQYLETLEINARVSAVPLDIIHLPVLLHLSLRVETNLPDGIGHIRSLRTLKYFDLGSNSVDNVLSLRGLINLQDLHLTYSAVKSAELHEHVKKNLAALAFSIGKLVNLKSITLAPGALDMAIYHDGSSSMSTPPIFLQRLDLSSPICIFSRLPQWIEQLRKLRVLKVVVNELLMKDTDIFTGLPALAVLSLYVRRRTAGSIIFKEGALPGLEYFKYMCGVLRLVFEEGAMPNLQRLKLGFNAHNGEQYGDLLAGIENLLNVKEIAGIIGAAAGADEPDRRAAESAFKGCIGNHPRVNSSYVNIRRIDRVEEYDLWTQVEGSSYSSSEQHEILQKKAEVEDSPNEHHEIQVEHSSGERHELLRKQHGSKEKDSSNEQPRILLEESEDKTQCANSGISHFPAPAPIMSLDHTKPDKGSSSGAETAAVVKSLIEGRDLAVRLRSLLHESPTAAGIVDTMLNNFSTALSAWQSSAAGSADGAIRQTAEILVGTRTSKRPPRRRSERPSVNIVTATLDDGHIWQKYGQRDIPNSLHPRSYYRCTHKTDQGCEALRHVQTCDSDPTKYTIKYFGNHTCRDPSTIPMFVDTVGTASDNPENNLTCFTDYSGAGASSQLADGGATHQLSSSGLTSERTYPTPRQDPSCRWTSTPPS